MPFCSFDSRRLTHTLITRQESVQEIMIAERRTLCAFVRQLRPAAFFGSSDILGFVGHIDSCENQQAAHPCHAGHGFVEKQSTGEDGRQWV